MEATEKQKRAFDKAFDQEWRKLFVHLMERKAALLYEVLPKHNLRSVSETETLFFEEMAKDGFHYYVRSYYEENKTPMIRSEDEIMNQVIEALNKNKKK